MQWLPVTSGVPQGTGLLEPLPFLIYMNDIVDNLSLELRLFVVDCILYKEIRSLSDCVVMQKDIDALHSWSLEWQVNFRAKNCHTICITRTCTKPLLSYKLDHENLSAVDSYPYRGAITLNDLRWNLHVNHISTETAFLCTRTVDVMTCRLISPLSYSGLALVSHRRFNTLQACSSHL